MPQNVESDKGLHTVCHKYITILDTSSGGKIDFFKF